MVAKLTIPKKITRISRDLNISESKVALVLYHYLTDCIQDILLDGETKTIFGKMKLDENSRIILETNKFGLISLLDKDVIYTIKKIAEDGPDYSIFK